MGIQSPFYRVNPLLRRVHPCLIWGLLCICVGWMAGCDKVQQILDPDPATTIKVGLVVSADRRISTQHGAQLALTQINEAGGIHGVPLELVSKNAEGDPHRAEKLAESLISQQVDP